MKLRGQFSSNLLKSGLIRGDKGYGV